MLQETAKNASNNSQDELFKNRKMCIDTSCWGNCCGNVKTFKSSETVGKCLFLKKDFIFLFLNVTMFKCSIVNIRKHFKYKMLNSIILKLF